MGPDPYGGDRGVCPLDVDDVPDDELLLWNREDVLGIDLAVAVEGYLDPDLVELLRPDVGHILRLPPAPPDAADLDRSD